MLTLSCFAGTALTTCCNTWQTNAWADYSLLMSQDEYSLLHIVKPYHPNVAVQIDHQCTTGPCDLPPMARYVNLRAMLETVRAKSFRLLGSPNALMKSPNCTGGRAILTVRGSVSSHSAAHALLGKQAKKRARHTKTCFNDQHSAPRWRTGAAGCLQGRHGAAESNS
jgi:hypothetical protein